MLELNNCAAIVTGGGSGMGAATARALAAAGCRVALLDVQQEKAAALAQELGGLALACDVTSEIQVQQALDAAARQHGPARIIINCAGIATAHRILGKEGPLALEAFRKVIDVNLIGTFNVLRLAAAALAGLEPLADGERGVIINTASIAAFEGQLGQAAYAASKGAIVGLTLPAAREFARLGVRVMTIAPGLIETPLFAGLKPEAVAALQASTLFPKRLGQPEEFAELALHIVRNSLLNGTVIRLDGAVRLA